MVLPVRKHRAPKGALRPTEIDACLSGIPARQKAPSAKRCIKTEEHDIGALDALDVSESTERQKVH